MSTNQNGLAVAGGSALVLDDERMDLLSRSIANGAPKLEFELFVADCNRRGLDPFAKQTYLIKRGDKWQQQTSIDGYRLIADRSGAYAGSDEPVFDVEDADHPNRATVTVWKFVNGQRCAFTSTARWSEYAVVVPVWENRQRVGEKLSDMWNRMPYTMLAKCAESAALRKAFPQELSGLYTHEEMQQADTAPTMRPAGDDGGGEILDEREVASRRFFAQIKNKGLTEDERRAIQRIAYGVESFTELDTKQINSLTLLIHEKSADELRERIKEQAELDRQAAQDQQDPVRDDDDAAIDPASPIPDFLRQIRAAKDEASLNGITQSMQAIGVWAPEITTAVVDKRNALGLPAPQADKGGMRPVGDILDQSPLLSGEPGMDRHSS